MNVHSLWVVFISEVIMLSRNLCMKSKEGISIEYLKTNEVTDA